MAWQPGYTNDMNTLYQATLMDHYRYPRNRGILEPTDFTGQCQNVNCGDSVRFYGQLDAHSGVIAKLTFQGQGCVLSQALASLISEAFINKSLADVFTGDDAAFVCALAGSELGPTRLKCALLALQALQEAISNYQNNSRGACARQI